MNLSRQEAMLTPNHAGQQRLQDPEIKLRVKKAKRTKAKDIWYWWHSETRDEEFTENGEQGYESDDEPDW